MALVIIISERISVKRSRLLVIGVPVVIEYGYCFGDIFFYNNDAMATAAQSISTDTFL